MSLITNRLIRFSEYEINCAQWQLYWRGEPVPLNRKSFDLLLYLVGNADRVVAKEELLKALWPGSFVEEANLTQHIFLLRKALSRHSSEEKIIVTVTGRGYRFAAAVEGQAAVESQVVVSAEPSVTRITMEEEVTADTEDGAAATGLISKTRGEEYSGESTPLLSRRQPTRQELLDGAARGGSFASRHMLAILLGAAAVLLTGVALRLYARPTLRVHGYARLTNDGLRKDPGFFTSVLTDGHRVFFTEFQMNRSLLARVGVDGGETLSAPAPSDNGQVADILPERNELLIGSAWATGEDTPMRIMDIGSGAFHTLSGIRGHDGSWSPDGKKLAFAQGSSLFVASLTGGGTSRIATLPGILFWPRWSPDGRLLRFSESFSGYQFRLWEVNADGTNLHLYPDNLPDKGAVCCGSWTSSGRSFVYLSVHSTSSDICVKSESAGWRWPWAKTDFKIKSEPLDRWSGAVAAPDGKHIFALGEQLHGRLMRIDPESRQLEPYLGGISAEGVAFSPDGDFIAFTAFPEGTLWRSRKDGTGRVQLTGPPLIARFPRWSPDGKTIVFVAGQAGSDWRLYTVPAGGGEIEPLTQSGVNEGIANWSPDGKTLSYGRLMDYSSSAKAKLSIEMFHLADGTSSIVPGSEGLWTARWSPDGRFLSALTSDSLTLRLYDLQRGSWSDLARMPINDVAWSPDSKYLFFDTPYGAEPFIYRLRISDLKLERWAALHDIHRSGFFAPWLGMGPDGSPILLEDASIQEIYSIGVDLR